MDFASIENEFIDLSDPLDFVEHISPEQHWICQRINEAKLSLNVRHGLKNHTIHLVWDASNEMLQLSCFIPIKMTKNAEQYLPSSLMDINSKLFLGHFIYDYKNDEDILRSIAFRHSISYKDGDGFSDIENIKTIIDIALDESTHFYPIFSMVSSEDLSESEKISLALSLSEGNA